MHKLHQKLLFWLCFNFVLLQSPIRLIFEIYRLDWRKYENVLLHSHIRNIAKEMTWEKNITDNYWREIIKHRKGKEKRINLAFRINLFNYSNLKIMLKPGLTASGRVGGSDNIFLGFKLESLGILTSLVIASPYFGIRILRRHKTNCQKY